MMKIISLLFVVMSLSCSLNSRDDSGFMSTSDLHADFLKLVEEYKIPSLVGGQLTDGEFTAIGVAGNRRIGVEEPVEWSDRFHLGSITKSMTAAVVARFVDQNKLAWNTKLSVIFPEITMHPDFKNTTIEDLLVHRAGTPTSLITYRDATIWKNFTSYAELEPGKTLDLSEEQLRAERYFVAQTVLSFEVQSIPSGDATYSNAGYIILGAVLEKLENKGWEEIVEEQLFQPLGMEECGFGPPAHPATQPATQPWAHYFHEGVFYSYYADNPPAVGPAGTVHCSLRSLAKFLQMHLDAANGDTSFFSRSTTLKNHSSVTGAIVPFTFGGMAKIVSEEGPILLANGSNTMGFARFAITLGTNTIQMVALNAAPQNSSEIVDKAIELLSP